MTTKLENEMFRTLSASELDVVSGGEAMEAAAGRYTAERQFRCRVNVLWPQLVWDNNATYAQNIQGIVKGIQDYADCLGGKPIR